MGAIPDLGAVRAAKILPARLGVIITADGVAELSRRGLLPAAGYFKDWPLYDGRAIEAFADPDAAEEASKAGETCSSRTMRRPTCGSGAPTSAN